MRAAAQALLSQAELLRSDVKRFHI
jgi:hypothetical protein